MHSHPATVEVAPDALARAHHHLDGDRTAAQFSQERPLHGVGARVPDSPDAARPSAAAPGAREVSGVWPCRRRRAQRGISVSVQDRSRSRGGPADRCHTNRDQALQFLTAEFRHIFARRYPSQRDRKYRSARLQQTGPKGLFQYRSAGTCAGTRGARLLSVTNDLYHPPLLACAVRGCHRLVAAAAQRHSRL